MRRCAFASGRAFAHRRAQKSSRGFTLIEVLVAMAITAIIGAMAYASLSTPVDAVNRSEIQGQRLSDINIYFAIFTKDIRQVVARPIRIETGEQEAALMSQEGDLVSLRLTRTGWQNPRPEVFVRSQLQRVHYQLENKTLVRESFYVLDRPEGEPMPIRSELLDKVTSVQFRFLAQPKSSSRDQLLDGEWVDSWPPQAAQQNAVQLNAIPSVIEIKLELEDWGEIRRVYDLMPNLIVTGQSQ